MSSEGKLEKGSSRVALKRELIQNTVMAYLNACMS